MRLSYLRDALVARDTSLDEAKKPCCTEEEFEGYIWDTATARVNPDGSYKAEAPVKRDDHGLDATRYMVAHLDLKDARDALYGQSMGQTMFGRPTQENTNPKEPSKYTHKGVDVLMPKWDVL